MPVDLEIVSPEKLLLSRPVDMVVIPAAEGEMGVLANHAPMIVLLRGGTIRCTRAMRSPTGCSFPAGLPRSRRNGCTVLANEAMPLPEVSRAEAERRLAAGRDGLRCRRQDRHGGGGCRHGPPAVGPRHDRGRHRPPEERRPGLCPSPRGPRKGPGGPLNPFVQPLKRRARAKRCAGRWGIARNEALADRGCGLGCVRRPAGGCRGRAARQGGGHGGTQRHRLRHLPQQRVPRRSGFRPRRRCLGPRGGAARRRTRPLGHAGRPRAGIIAPLRPLSRGLPDSA